MKPLLRKCYGNALLQHYPPEMWEYRNYFGDEWGHLNLDALQSYDVHVVKSPPADRGYEVFLGDSFGEIDESEGVAFYLFPRKGEL